jgi:hypothetical protein
MSRRSGVGSVSARHTWPTAIVPAGARQLLLLAFLAAVPVVLTVGVWWLLAGPGRRVNSAAQAWLAPRLPTSGLGLCVLVAGVMAGLATVTALVVRRSDRRAAAEFEAWRLDWNTRADARLTHQLAAHLGDRFAAELTTPVALRPVTPAQAALILGPATGERPALPGAAAADSRGDAGTADVGPVLGVLTPIAAFAALVQVVATGEADLLVPLAGIVAVSGWLLAARLRYARRTSQAALRPSLLPAPRRSTDATGPTSRVRG